MSHHDIAVSVRDLSKSYTIAHNAPKHTTLGEAIAHTLKGLRGSVPASEKETFWALKDVEFDIKKGDVVGIIGRNGAGKSTLLKVLSRITEPTTGQIDIYGRVGSLLEVGTGFHPELTGRENVYMNGAILGMSKGEIRKHFDEIVAFAEVEKFLDTPVKRYSSGMYVRLAFAVAAHLNPEILIVDEVLAVGDAAFQKKCLGKMKDVSQMDGRTVLFVSHNMAAIRQLCTQGIFLTSGNVSYNGDVEECLLHYAQRDTQMTDIVSNVATLHDNVSISKVLVNGSSHSELELPGDCQTLRIEFIGSLLKPRRVEVEVLITDLYDVKLGFFSPGHDKAFVEALPVGDFHIIREIQLPNRIFKGEYLLHLSLTEPDVEYLLDLPRAVHLIVEGVPTETGRTLHYHDRGWISLTEPERDLATSSESSLLVLS